MTLLALGINYTTAPVSIRERLAFPSEGLSAAVKDLWGQANVSEAAILSTCNRTEIYCAIQDNDSSPIINWIAQHHQLSPADFQPYLYTHTDNALIRHIFRVASGLESMILGEPQILGQIKTAYQTANTAGTLGKDLGKLFQHTFSTAKKVRTDTEIGSSSVSVAFAAVQLSKQIFDDLGQQTALLIGAGETIELTARHLHQNGIKRIIIANRTYEKAHALANQFDGYAIPLSDLSLHIADADILVSSTASQLPILGKGLVESAIKHRRHKPMFMVDLAVPRDIEPEVAKLNDIYLYTVDDLQNIINDNLNSRKLAAEQAEEIIDTRVENFSSWIKAQTGQSTIVDYRQHAAQLQQESLVKALSALKNGTDPEAVLQQLAHTLTNKLTHTPCTQLRIASENERHDLIAAAREIFNLPD